MKYLLLLAVTLLTTLSYGQSKKFTFKLGSEFELPRKSEDLSFFGNPKDGVVNLSLKKDEIIIVKFNSKTLEQAAENIIELPEATKNFNSEIITEFKNGNYFWLHSDWDKSSEVETLYYDKLDVGGTKLTASNTKMFETTRLSGDLASTGFYQMKVQNKYQFNYDAEGKKLLVNYRLWPEEKNDKKKKMIGDIMLRKEEIKKNENKRRKIFFLSVVHFFYHFFIIKEKQES